MHYLCGFWTNRLMGSSWIASKASVQWLVPTGPANMYYDRWISHFVFQLPFNSKQRDCPLICNPWNTFEMCRWWCWHMFHVIPGARETTLNFPPRRIIILEGPILQMMQSWHPPRAPWKSLGWVYLYTASWRIKFEFSYKIQREE